MMKKQNLFGLALVLCLLCAAAAQAQNTWTGAVDNSWATGGNWSDGTVPDASDVATFNTGTTLTVTGVPAVSIQGLNITNNTNLTLQAGGAVTLTIAGGTGTDFIVDAGSTLTVSGASVLTILVSTGATGSVGGDITFTGGLHRLNAADASAITFNSGADFTQGTGCTGNVFTAAGTQNAIVFASGSTFHSQAGANPFGFGQPNSKVVFQTGSTYSHEQNSAPGFVGRTYANFVVNAASFSQTSTGFAAVATIDNLTVTNCTAFNFNLTGGITITGNITVDAGTLSFSPLSANTLTLNGSATQTIGGSGGTITFGTNATLSAQQAITLNRNISVSALTLTSNINLNGNTLRVGTTTTPGTITGTGRVYGGSLVRFIDATTAFDFPIGTSTNNRNASIQFGTAPNADVTVQHTDENSINFIPGIGSTTFPVTVGGETVQAALNLTKFYWTISSATANAYTLRLRADGAPAITTLADVRILKRANAASAFTFDGAAGTNTTGPTVIERTGMSGFSDFVLGSIDPSAETLPVTFLSFTAQQQAGGAQLAWRTANELNNKGFFVQRSSNPAFAPYDELGFVAGAGTVNETRSYSFTDGQLPAGQRVYYRLYQVDLDGGYDYSPGIELQADAASSGWVIWPNPTQGRRSLIKQDDAVDAQDPLLLQLYAANGQPLASTSCTVVNLNEVVSNWMQNRLSGMYLLQLQHRGTVYTLRVLQQ